MCTLGPATASTERIRELVDAGMDVARLNLSHGAYADHEAVYHRVRQAADESGHGVGVFVDLQGPKIRLGKFREGSSRIQTGQSFTITTRDVAGDNEIASTTYAGLPGTCPRATRSSSTTARCACASSRSTATTSTRSS